MRVFYLVLILIVVILLSIFILKRYRLNIYGMTILVTVCICIWLIVGALVNINTLPKDVQEKIDYVQTKCGDAYVMQNKGIIYVKINKQWVDLNEVSILGNFTKDLYLEYDGKSIFVGHSGIYNTIKALESVGLIETK